MNKARKFTSAVALLILVIVIFVLPISLFLRNLGVLLFDAESMKSFVSNTVDAKFVSDLASDVIRERLIQGAETDDPVSVFVQRGLEGLEDEAWNQIVARFVPPELIVSTTDAIVDAYVEWLDSDGLLPAVTIDLISWKDNIKSGPDELIAIVLQTLPQCSVEEIGSQLLEGLSNETGLPGLIPLCNPPEPLYSALLSNADGIAQSVVVGIPNEIQLDLDSLEGIASLGLLQENLLRVRTLLKNAWLLALGVAGVAVMIGAQRSWSAALKWTGWLLSLSAINTIALGQNLEPLGSLLLKRINALIFQQKILFVSEILNLITENVLESLGHQLVLQGILLLVIGLTALISWNLLPQIQSQANGSFINGRG